MSKPLPKPQEARKKSPEEQLREAVNNAAIALVAAGFSAIDDVAERGKDGLKKAIIRGMSAARKDPER